MVYNRLPSMLRMATRLAAPAGQVSKNDQTIRDQACQRQHYGVIRSTILTYRHGVVALLLLVALPPIIIWIGFFSTMITGPKLEKGKVRLDWICVSFPSIQIYNMIRSEISDNLGYLWPYFF